LAESKAATALARNESLVFEEQSTEGLF